MKHQHSVTAALAVMWAAAIAGSVGLAVAFGWWALFAIPTLGTVAAMTREWSAPADME